MADANSDNDLRRLEREAEAARARLHETIAEIKDPRTIENAKLEMKHRAEDVKDQIVDYIKGAKDNAVESGRAQGNEFTRKLQRTAIENPMSVALIGAGIGWHLYKKPPITTVLIGAGIWTMMKGWNNSPNDAAFRDPYNRISPRGYVPGGVAGYGYDEVTDIASATDRVKAVATNLTYSAQNAVAGVEDAITGATDRVREAVGMGGDKTRNGGAHAADDMSRLGSSMADRASGQYANASARAQDLAHDAKGAAQNLADSAKGAMQNVADQARGVADQARDMAGQAADQARDLADQAQRRLQPVVDRLSPWLDEQHRGQLGMVMVLGGIGVLAGGWLRGSDTGRRWMSEARDRLGESWNDVEEKTAAASRDMSRRVSVEDWRDQASSTMGRFSDQASSVMSRVSDQASSAMSRVSDQASSLRRSAMDNSGDLRERGAATMRSAQELSSEHPLLLSAIGLAIGAVLGGMIRQTPFERETFGAMAENMRDTAVDTLQTGMENVVDRATHVAEAVVGAVSGGSNDDPAKLAQAQRGRVNA